jgi:MFS family permease
MNSVYTVASFPADILADRVGTRKIISLGYTVFALTYAGFAVVSDSAHIWALIAVYGLYRAFTVGGEKAFVVELSGGQHFGTHYGFYNSAVGVFGLPASIIAGALWASLGPSYAFIYGAAMAFSALVLFMVLPGLRGSNSVTKSST